MRGNMDVRLHDPVTGKTTVVMLSAERHETLFIDVGVAHKVTATTGGAVLLVLASSPGVKTDDFLCEIP